MVDLKSPFNKTDERLVKSFKLIELKDAEYSGPNTAMADRVYVVYSGDKLKASFTQQYDAYEYMVSMVTRALSTSRNKIRIVEL